MIETGIRGESRRKVDSSNTASSFQSGLLDVLATPALVALMEYTSFKSVEPYLEPGQGTVGTYLEVEHCAASPVGAEVICRSELVEIDRRRLRFRVECTDARTGEVIGRATHDRFVIDNERFMQKCLAKQQASAAD